jgi:hypothetical protein
MNGQRILAAMIGCVLGLSLAVSARAHSFYGGHPFGHGGGFNHGVTDPQCRQNCQQTNLLCLKVAQSDAYTCASTTCTTERQTAHDACTADFTSTACRTARMALRQCLQPCKDNLRTAVGTCQSNAKTCQGVCASATPVPGQQQCITACRGALQTCRQAAGTAERTCVSDCSTLITAAEQICIANPRGSGCRAALQAAGACLQPCEHAQQTAAQLCVQAAQGCETACVNPNPATPTVTPTETPTETPTPGM